MGKGKGGTQTTEVKLPEDIKKAAAENQNLVKNIASLGYNPNMGASVAGFTPSQEAAFANTNKAASAFGLQSSPGTGLPPAQNIGGFSGYSTKTLYDDMLSKMDPAAKAKYDTLMNDPFSKNPFNPAPAASSGKGGGKPGKPTDLLFNRDNQNGRQ
jgi:hypothetical protein